ncbi:MAG TPA: hypothetical protein VKQ73_03805 [Stellaceae bacterium]|nr:hypothetical protein [Stellaceae bacterium]
MLRWLGVGLLFGAAVATTAWAQGAAAFDGQYVGELTLTRTVSGDCTPPPLAAVYPLNVARGEVSFAYVPRFATTLRGRIDAKGNFTAAARVPSGLIRMTGRIQGLSATATIASPSCNYTFQTK